MKSPVRCRPDPVVPAARTIDAPPHLLADLAQPLAHGLERSARGHQVAPCDDAAIVVDEHHVRADRADVDAEVDGDRFAVVAQHAHGRRRGRGARLEHRHRAAIAGRLGAHELAQRLEAVERGPFPARRVLLRDDRRADRCHQPMVLGHDELAWLDLQQRLEGANDRLVEGDAALDEDRRRERLPLADDAAEVACEREAEPGEDVGERRALLLQVDHVRLREDGATAGDARRALGLERERRELAIDPDAQALGLLVEEGAGAGGAERVHGEVAEEHAAGRIIALEGEELAVLPADLDDRARVGVVLLHGASLRDQFVHVVAADERGDRFAAGSAEADAPEVGQVVPALELRVSVQQHPARLPPRAEVLMRQDLVLRVQEDELDRGGADIDAEEQFRHGALEAGAPCHERMARRAFR